MMQLLVEGGIKAAPLCSLAQAFVPRFVDGKKAEQNEDTRPAAYAFQRVGGSAGDVRDNGEARGYFIVARAM